jgi:hypothetical protein
MSNKPMKAGYQASLDERKRVADLSVAQAKSAALKSKREQDAKHALTDHEVKRVTTLAKTARLRKARLALAADIPPKKATSRKKPTLR